MNQDADGREGITRREFLGKMAMASSLLYTGAEEVWATGANSRTASPTRSSASFGVAVRAGRLRSYPEPSAFPFGPDTSPVYNEVVECLRSLFPDCGHNPLRGVIDEGDRVVIKPNFCSLAHYPDPITHPSLLTPLVDLAVGAGASSVTVAESPIDYQEGLQLFRGKYTNVVRLMDVLQDKHTNTKIRFVDTAFDAFTWVRLGHHSELQAIARSTKLYHPDFRSVEEDIFYYAVDSSGTELSGYEVGCYAISNTFLNCDCLISVPKLKTHNQTGITCALKGMMGVSKSFMGREISGRARRDLPKEWSESPHSRDVPHFGLRGESMDECMRDPERARRVLNYDNDVLWRSLADLNKITKYADRSGSVTYVPKRKHLYVVDAIVAGEGEGPIGVTPRPLGVLAAGVDPVSVDGVCLHIMGWDPTVIPLVQLCAQTSGLAVGALAPLGTCLRGAESCDPAFQSYFAPPHTYSDEVLYPITVRG